jgi:hypothetical protein
MNKISYIFIVCVLACGLSACHPSSGNNLTPTPSALIVGKWNLQQQKTEQYINGALKTDTTYLTSATNVANLQFNKDGTYHSVSRFVAEIGTPIANPLNGGVSYTAGQDSTYGIYNITNTSLNFSAFVAGFITSGPASFGTTTTIPVFTLISNTSQINELTTSKFNMHTEVVYTEAVNNETTTYKNEIDSYYTK